MHPPSLLLDPGSLTKCLVSLVRENLLLRRVDRKSTRCSSWLILSLARNEALDPPRRPPPGLVLLGLGAASATAGAVIAVSLALLDDSLVSTTPDVVRR